MHAILLLNFGEPETADAATVIPFLERIFLANARLDPATDPAAVRRRARELAERRAPGLVEEYRAIGGSPQNAQAAAQAQRLQHRLRDAGHDAIVLVGMQFTDPDIAAAVARAREAGARAVIGLPVYPLSGPSTTLAALEDMRRAMDELGWGARVTEVAGWHAHPAYTRLCAEGIRAFCGREGLDLADPGTRLVFSAHGTPIRYLEEGSRYDHYVQDHCRRLAAELAVDRYVLGYQNHSNRPGLEWTQPGIDRALEDVRADRVVVVPVSFMQEQSETLFELDHALRPTAEARGLAFHRVPIPHDDPRFIEVLVELVTPFLDGDPDAAGLGPCGCRPGARCLPTQRPPRPAQGRPIVP